MGKFDEVKNAASLREYAERNLQRKGRTFVCPKCGSGNGPNGTPAFSITPDGKSWKCFSCDRGGDVFDLAGLVIKSDDKAAQLEEVARFAGVQLEEGGAARADSLKYADGRRRHTRYVEECRNALENHDEAVSYIESRGFSLEDARRFGLGYDPRARRVVIPYPGCSWYHVDRAIDPEPTDSERRKHWEKYHKPKTDDVGPEPIFNPAAAAADLFFIVEGPLDALAVMACGYPALAVCGSSAGPSKAAQIKNWSRGGYAVVMMDRDDAGAKGGAETVETLAACRVAAINADEAGVAFDFNDAAEAFKTEREALAGYLGFLAEHARRYAADALRERSLEALKSLRPISVSDVAAGLVGGAYAYEPVPTGIFDLDAEIGGGLPRGLTMIGATSSSGKTTLALQMADSIAAAGRRVVFVTIEQSGAELVAKSLSRIAADRLGVTVTAAQVLTPSRRVGGQGEAIVNACAIYDAEIGPNITILEAASLPTASDILTAIEIIGGDESPVVFVDYLQLVRPEGDRVTDKQAVDQVVPALRQLARDKETAVVVISSLNRAAYQTGVMMDSFKESGIIEYSADLLLGIQPAGIEAVAGDPSKPTNKTKVDRFVRRSRGDSVRDVEVHVLKNRNGKTPAEGIVLEFHALESRFIHKYEAPASSVPTI